MSIINLLVLTMFFISWDIIYNQSVGTKYGVFNTLEDFFEIINKDYFDKTRNDSVFEIYSVIEFVSFPLILDSKFNDDSFNFNNMDIFKNEVIKKIKKIQLDSQPDKQVENKQIFLLLKFNEDKIILDINKPLCDDDDDELISFPLNSYDMI